MGLKIRLFLAAVALAAGPIAGCSREKPLPEAARGSLSPHPAKDLQARPRFSFQERAGVWWLVDPAARALFSLGVCVVDRGQPPEIYDPRKPGYAAFRHYPDDLAWADTTIERLHSWGFTTVGGWGDLKALRRSPRLDLLLTPVLAAGMEAGAPWFDLWDPAVIERIEELARAKIAAARDDPRLVGYYTDNEMGWWNFALFKMTLEHPAASGQRRRLLALFRERYAGDWKGLLRDFDPEGAGSFDDLERGGTLYLRPGGEGIRALRAFLELVAERYYELLSGIVRRMDPRALVLGDRYQSFYYPEVARAAGRHLDAISTNLNVHFSDGDFARFYLETLHQLSGKPVLASEFYLAAAENRSGDPNSHGRYPVVATQAQRADGFRRTLAGVAGVPWVVGADWFQYYDEPPSGRFDGEDFNFGLVDIEDRPYEELVAAARAAFPSTLHRDARRPRPDASGGIPPAPAIGQTLGAERALERWDRERGFVRASSRFPMADLYLAWSPEALQIGLLALDLAEGGAYRNGRVPDEDRMEWTVQLEGVREPIRIRLGAGQPPSGGPPGSVMVSRSGEKIDLRAFAILRVRAELLGRPRLEAGDQLRLSSSLSEQARAWRTEWSGEFRLAP